MCATPAPIASGGTAAAAAAAAVAPGLRRKESKDFRPGARPRNEFRPPAAAGAAAGAAAAAALRGGPSGR
eukprot:scaffold101822_cov18-Phaeocystis_antarctica.AAC.1